MLCDDVVGAVKPMQTCNDNFIDISKIFSINKQHILKSRKQNRLFFSLICLLTFLILIGTITQVPADYEGIFIITGVDPTTAIIHPDGSIHRLDGVDHMTIYYDYIAHTASRDLTVVSLRLNGTTVDGVNVDGTFVSYGENPDKHYHGVLIISGLPNMELVDSVYTLEVIENSQLTTIPISLADLIKDWYTVRFFAWDDEIATNAEITNYTQLVPSGEPALAPPDPERIGYTFTGWDKDFTNIQSNLTVTAQYTPNKYTIQYDANGGTGSMTNTPTTYDADVTLQTNTFSREGYMFLGWNTHASGLDIFYDDGATFKFLNPDDLTLYAQWVQYGGVQKELVSTGPYTIDDTVTYLITYTLPNGVNNINSFKIIDTYPFAVLTYVDATVKIDNDALIDVSEDANAGVVTFTIDPSDLTSEGVVTIELNFKVINVDTGISNTAEVFINDKSIGTENEILYKVTYDANYPNDLGLGVVPVDEYLYVSGDIVKILGMENLEADGYVFAGWSLTESGDVITSFEIYNDETLYARWLPIELFRINTVEKRVSGPDSYSANGLVLFVVKYTLPSDIIFYDFSIVDLWIPNDGFTPHTGYSLLIGDKLVEESAVTNMIDDGHFIIILDDLSLLEGNADITFLVDFTIDSVASSISNTAIVNINHAPVGSDTAYLHKLSYDPNYPDDATNPSGDVPETKLYVSGATVDVERNPGDLVADGYVFAGWSIDKDGPVLTEFNIDDETTLYAKWKPLSEFKQVYKTSVNTSATPFNMDDPVQFLIDHPLETDMTYTSFTIIDTWVPAEGLTYTGYTLKAYIQSEWVDIGGYVTDCDISEGSVIFTIDPMGFVGASRIYLYVDFDLDSVDDSIVNTAEIYVNGVFIGSGEAGLYRVTYDPNYPVGATGHGDVPVDDQLYMFYGNVLLKGNDCDLIVEDYVFIGWSFYDSGPVFDDFVFLIQDTTTLYAQWMPVEEFDSLTKDIIGSGPLEQDDPIEYLVTYELPAGIWFESFEIVDTWNPANGLNYVGYELKIGDTLVADKLDVIQDVGKITFRVNDLGPYDVSSDFPVLNYPSVFDNGATLSLMIKFTLADTSEGIVNTAKVIVNCVEVSDSVEASLYKVTYNPNYPATTDTSGTAPTDPNLYVNGDTVTVADNGDLTVVGYRFDGWSLTQIGTIVTHFVIENNDETLYAQWTRVYSLTYDVTSGVDGTGPDVEENLLDGVTYPLNVVD
ncbi:MAG: InlB B-repeat-containing protein, partial [Candidatus Bathyarchaeota archaeon]|nr:InlB B-repeat-containing protein [Candidatus Termiticorpusculum sp.]